MSEITLKAELTREGEIKTKCNIRGIEDNYDILTLEMVAILTTIDDKFPGLIGDALDVMLESVRRGC